MGALTIISCKNIKAVKTRLTLLGLWKQISLLFTAFISAEPLGEFFASERDLLMLFKMPSFSIMQAVLGESWTHQRKFD